MAQTKKIEQDRWVEFLGMFSNGNRGRMVAIEVADMEIGDQILTDTGQHGPVIGLYRFQIVDAK